jgi:type I restriction enzyme M protein
MLTETLRRQIDKIWEHIRTSPLDPLTFIEQISFLMLARLLDFTGEGLQPTRFTPKQQTRRWAHFDDMLTLVRAEVSPHFKMIGGNVGKYLANAQLRIDNPQVLKSVVNTIDKLPLMDNESAAELYEYLLSKLTTAGMKGQFRTPRLMVRLMLEMLDPQPDEIIGDPVCGTGGFLVGVLQYIKENNTLLENGVKSDDDEKSYRGVSLKPSRAPIQNDRLHGFDIDFQIIIFKMNSPRFCQEENFFHIQPLQG